MSGLEVWILLVAAVTLLVAIIQLIGLAGIIFALRRLQVKKNQIEEKLDSYGIDPYKLAAKSYQLIENLDAATSRATEVSVSVKELLAEARSDLTRIEASVNNVVEEAGRTASNIKRGVAEPVVEYRAITAGVRSALKVLGRRRVSTAE